MGPPPPGFARPSASAWGDWDPGELLGRLTVQAQLLEGPTLHVRRHFSLADLHPELPESGTGLTHLSCLCLRGYLAAPTTDYLQRHGLFSFSVHSTILLRKRGIKY